MRVRCGLYGLCELWSFASRVDGSRVWGFRFQGLGFEAFVGVFFFENFGA